jgi:hypothetical protein
MNSAALEQDDISGYYDKALQILFVTYRGILTPASTAVVYSWLNGLIEAHGIREARGSVFDFRMVTNFAVGNLSATQTHSYRLNNEIDLSNHPVALLVHNIYQRAMVKAALNVTPQQERKRIVHTLEGALSFIEHWHEQLIQKS